MNVTSTGRIFLTALLFSGLATFISCQKGSELDIPSYIAIDSIRLSVTGDQGTAYNKIVDAWVYTDNDLEGAFELPDTFPVLKTGSLQLKILPGIKINGMAETRAAYPFFNPITIPLTLTHEKVTEIGNKVTTYNSNTVFAWFEDFEDPNVSIDTTSRSDVKLTRVGDPSLASLVAGEGNSFCGKVVIQNDSSIFECISHDSFVFPQYTSDLESSVFMELSYKTNCPFTVGLFIHGAQTVQKPIVVVNPSSTWNKIYINLTPTVLLNTDATSFRVFINAQKAENGPDAQIYLDNIKLLHF